MSPLLRQEFLDEIDRHVLRVSARFEEALRTAQYGVDGQGTPPGMVNLNTPEKRRIWASWLKRQATQEQDGTVPGDIASTVVKHPAVAEMIDDERPV